MAVGVKYEFPAELIERVAERAAELLSAQGVAPRTRAPCTGRGNRGSLGRADLRPHRWST